MEGAYRAKDELLAVRETEVQQILLLRTELEQLKARKRHDFSSFDNPVLTERGWSGKEGGGKERREGGREGRNGEGAAGRQAVMDG